MERQGQQQSDESGEREVDPAEAPEPRDNPEVDEERLDRDREDLDRAGAN
jgi:hypothetical protein